ncbi:MAG: M48 family metallopeptidase [Gemmataceae bacterium]
MPLVTIFVVLLAEQGVPWPEPLFGGTLWHIVLTTLLITAIPVLYLANVSVRVVSMLRRFPYRRGTAARLIERGRLIGGLLGIAGLALSLGVSGWGWLVWQRGEPGLLMPFGEMLTPLPLFISTILGWIVMYPAERALFSTSVESPGIPFYTLFEYVGNKFRFYAVFVLFPAFVTAGQQTLGRYFPQVSEHPLTIALGVLGILAMLTFLPLLVPRLFGWVRMRNDAVRERLERLAKRARFRYRDLYVWPTRGSMTNALVLGIIPQARFVVFTDRLLDTLDADELDAVFGHEIGHAHHAHIPFYTLFLVLSGCAITAGVAAIIELMKWNGISVPEAYQDWLIPIPVILLGVYLFLAFGFLSRRCERQADLFGSKAVSCSNARCEGHDENTVFPETVGTLCPTGLRTFSNALDRVGGAEGTRPRGLAKLWAMIRSWQHGPTGDRIDYLMGLIERPELERQFQRRVFALRLFIALSLITITAGLIWLVGWKQVLSGL